MQSYLTKLNTADSADPDSESMGILHEWNLWWKKFSKVVLLNLEISINNSDTESRTEMRRLGKDRLLYCYGMFMQGTYNKFLSLWVLKSCNVTEIHDALFFFYLNPTGENLHKTSIFLSCSGYSLPSSLPLSRLYLLMFNYSFHNRLLQNIHSTKKTLRLS